MAVLLAHRTEPRTTEPGDSARVDSYPPLLWKLVGWFGALFAATSLGDMALTFYPLNFGRPEWEFGAIAAGYAGLPLVATGLGALLVAGLALRKRWLVVVAGISMGVVGAMLTAGTALFLLDVPLALRLAPAEVQLGIKKTIAKTLLLGTTFPAAFLIAAVAALRHSPTRGGATHA